MTKSLVQQQFGAHAATYVTSAVHAKGASLARVVELVAPRPDWHALDVATGAGHMALAFAPYVTRVVASDITPEMLEERRSSRQRAGSPTSRRCRPMPRRCRFSAHRSISSRAGSRRITSRMCRASLQRWRAC